MQSMTECLLHNGQLTLRTDIKLLVTVAERLSRNTI